jgi:DNA modification methylase
MTERVVIGNAELWHGDCREVLPLLPSVDSVITDPPYGVGLDYGDFVDTQDNVRELAAVWLPQARAIAQRVCFTPGVRNQWIYPEPTWVLGWFIGGGGSAGFWGFGMWQPILVYGPCPYMSAGKGRRPDTIYTALASTNTDKNEHPCPKPVDVWTKVIGRCSTPGGIVVDPFMGSGTGGIACHTLGNPFIGIERERKYFDIACERISRAQAQGTLLPAEPEREPVQEGLL